jgi:hypothetical protein
MRSSVLMVVTHISVGFLGIGVNREQTGGGSRLIWVLRVYSNPQNQVDATQSPDAHCTNTSVLVPVAWPAVKLGSGVPSALNRRT